MIDPQNVESHIIQQLINNIHFDKMRLINELRVKTIYQVYLEETCWKNYHLNEP